MAERRWSVWVGGVEVNSCYLSELEADALLAEYIADGYDDAIKEQING